MSLFFPNGSPGLMLYMICVLFVYQTKWYFFVC